MTDKEIIQALRICATHKDKGCGLCPQRKYVRCTERLADEAITMIERLTAENAALREKVPRWISVEDRLPEVWKNEENDVLVNYMIYAPEFGADIGNYHAEAKRWLCMAIPCTVTHWMPLPEAPEEGEKA
jgi:hypothetical protein